MLFRQIKQERLDIGTSNNRQAFNWKIPVTEYEITISMNASHWKPDAKREGFQFSEILVQWKCFIGCFERVQVGCNFTGCWPIRPAHKIARACATRCPYYYRIFRSLRSIFAFAILMKSNALLFSAAFYATIYYENKWFGLKCIFV